MSPPKNKGGGRFGYLSSATRGEDAPAKRQRAADEAGAETDGAARTSGDAATASSNGGGGRGNTRQKRDTSRRKAAPAEQLKSVPKGQGRMRQARSQLNVRLPTPLKRQATAKAVLEGRDIGEVIEELLREYLDS